MMNTHVTVTDLDTGANRNIKWCSPNDVNFSRDKPIVHKNITTM